MGSAAVNRVPAVGPRACAELGLQAEELLSWLAVEKGRRPNTLAAYRRDLVGDEFWLRDRASTYRGASRRPQVARYIAHLRESGLAPASVARSMVAVRSLHRFLVREGTTMPTPLPA